MSAFEPAEVALAVTVAGCAVAAAVAVRRRTAPPVWVAVAVALALRVGVAAFASRYTPTDVTHHFRLTGEWVRHGWDPLGGAHPLPAHDWNFLPLMAYVHALEQLLGLRWEYAVKIAPIVADCITVWLVWVVADADRRTRAWQYALNPVSLLVVSLHGQVEPVALCLAMGALALYQRDHLARAGLLAGAAVAAKTWPVLVVVALFRRSWRTGWLVAAAAVVPLAVLASGLVFLDTRLGPTVRGVLSYRAYVGIWTWSGALVTHWGNGVRGYDSPLGVVGAIVAVEVVVAVLWVFRDAPAATRVALVLSAVVVVTAGFGAQYLMWPVPFLCAAGLARREWYLAVAGVWLLLGYAPHAFANIEIRDAYLTGSSWLVVLALGTVIAAVPRAKAPTPLP